MLKKLLRLPSQDVLCIHSAHSTRQPRPMHIPRWVIMWRNADSRLFHSYNHEKESEHEQSAHRLSARRPAGRRRNDLRSTSDFLDFLGKAYRVWKDGSLSDPDKGNEIRRLALVALANRDEDDEEDETSIHTDGPAEPHTQAGTLESYIDRDGFIRLADGRLLDVRPGK